MGTRCIILVLRTGVVEDTLGEYFSGGCSMEGGCSSGHIHGYHCSTRQMNIDFGALPVTGSDTEYLGFSINLGVSCVATDSD
jgi:hypothetical protein